ncbi:MAG: DUF4340 domain-containing protein [Verrucomicrobia bacterium]|nr:DUF4340 domain-containing protein [Verrucomicrobiota bacterium]
MNSRSTWIWIGLAAALFAVTFALEKFGAKPPTVQTNVLPGLKAAAITGIQLKPAGQDEIRAVQSSNTWRLLRPVAYPAQVAAIQNLLVALEKLSPAHIISGAEFRSRTNTDAEFGLINPQASIVLQGQDERRLRVGSLTAPGDQVYVQVVGVDGVFIVDADWLSLLPKSGDDWRDTALADFSTFDFSRIAISNANGVIDLQFDATNKLWSLPRSHARADGGRMESSLRSLLTTRVAQFITDNTNADLEAFGLQPPALEITFSHGTNITELLQFGKAVATNTAMCYARRPGWNTIFTIPSAQLAPWHAPVQDFRDHQLLAITRPVDEIEIRGTETFTLRRAGSNDWRIVGQEISADHGWAAAILTNIAALKIVSIWDAVTTFDLPKYGLDAPGLEIILRNSSTNGSSVSNTVIAQLGFGTNRDDLVFVRRADESSSVYGVPQAGVQKLPVAAWQLRDRRIWNFSGTNVARITAQLGARTWFATHKGTNSWEFSPGALTPPNDFALEDIADRFGELSSTLWVERDARDLAKYEVTTNGYSATVQLRTGEKFTVNLGRHAPSGYAYAATVVDGKMWVFEFPIGLYELFMYYVVAPYNPT